ncbi:MAG: tail fiber domain-containing protein [Rhodospirillales bacterium]|nr:MAG: tail fiber domain-containing protein [Rhodospirillales bacterium]
MGDFAFDLKNTSVDGDVPTEIMRLKKTGNVGIGTNAPAYKLDVNGAINGTSVLVNGVPVASSTDTYWNAGGSGSINYTGGNVGIGTAAPGTKLTVYSNTNGPKLRLEDESDPDAASSAGLNYMEFYGNSARKGLIGYSSGTLDMSISNEAAGGLRFLANNAEAMRVTSTGNVGIGISSPAAKLDVASTLTNTAGGIVPNQRTVMTLNPASASSSTFYNRYSQINTAGASNLTSIVGDNELINHTTSATISSAIGLGATAGNNGSGTITGGIGVVGTTGNSAGGSIGTATGVLARVQNSSTGTITTARSIQAEYLNNGGGTVSSWYGLYVPSIAGNTPPTTDRFPIYVADAGNSYFAGNVGIGTTSPGAKLEVDGASIWLNNGTSDAYFYMGSNTSQGRIHWDNNNSKLYLGMAGNDYLTVGSAGTIRFNAYGAGTLTTDASGNITASSDERLKDIQGPFARGLDDITKINPILYKWLPASGNETSGVYAGMSAQDVQKAIPEAVGHDSRGYLTLSDRPIEAALINAVKELKAANDHLVGENAALKTQLDAMDARLKALEAK